MFFSLQERQPAAAVPVGGRGLSGHQLHLRRDRGLHGLQAGVHPHGIEAGRGRDHGGAGQDQGQVLRRPGLPKEDGQGHQVEAGAGHLQGQQTPGTIRL